MLTALSAHVLSLLAVASLALSLRNRGAVTPTIVAAAVTFPSRCCHAVAVTLPLSCHRVAAALPSSRRCGHVAGIAITLLL